MKKIIVLNASKNDLPKNTLIKKSCSTKVTYYPFKLQILFSDHDLAEKRGKGVSEVAASSQPPKMASFLPALFPTSRLAEKQPPTELSKQDYKKRKAKKTPHFPVSLPGNLHTHTRWLLGNNG